MPASVRLQASGTLRAKCGTFQVALKPLAVICRWSGKKAPPKLGCGQFDASETRVSRATGAKSSETEPLKASSNVNLNGAVGLSASGRTAGPARLGVQAGYTLARAARATGEAR